MIKKIIASIKVIEVLLLAVTYILGFVISHYLGYHISWTGLISGFVILISITLGIKLLGNYIYRNSIILSTANSGIHNDKTNNQEIQNFGSINLFTSLAFFAVGLIPAIALFRLHIFNAINLTILAIAILFLGMVEIFHELTSRWGLTEVFKSFVYANLVPVLAFTFQTGLIHRFDFLLTFPLFFLFLSFFIVLSLARAHIKSDETPQSLISRFGPFIVLRLHNVSVLIGFLFFLLASFFEVPWRIIWPPLIMIPIGLIQIWQVNQILAGKKPNIKVLELTAISISFFCSYFLILGLWLN